MELKFEEFEALGETLKKTEAKLDNELKNKTIFNYLTEEKYLLEFYHQKLLFMESQYLSTQKKHFKSLEKLLKGVQIGCIYSLKLRLAYLNKMDSTFNILGVNSHKKEITFLKSVYKKEQNRHFFLIIDKTSQFIYQFKYVQDFLKLLIAQVKFGDILSIFSFDESIKVRHTKFVLETSENKDIGEIRKMLNLCLLYTSPSPRDLSTSRMPSSA